jgi:hypothetical protein
LESEYSQLTLLSKQVWANAVGTAPRSTAVTMALRNESAEQNDDLEWKKTIGRLTVAS